MTPSRRAGPRAPPSHARGLLAVSDGQRCGSGGGVGLAKGIRLRRRYHREGMRHRPPRWDSATVRGRGAEVGVALGVRRLLRGDEAVGIGFVQLSRTT